LKFFGSQETRYHDAFFRISDREKTLLDCLDRFDLSGGMDDYGLTHDSRRCEQSTIQANSVPLSGGFAHGRYPPLCAWAGWLF
jgi:predicted transcriptional regulator of viral defense system